MINSQLFFDEFLLPKAKFRESETPCGVEPYVRERIFRTIATG